MARWMQRSLWAWVMVVGFIVTGIAVPDARGQQRPCASGSAFDFRPLCFVSERLFPIEDSLLQELDPRAVQLVDVNGDVAPDAVALFKNHHRPPDRATIVLWINHCIGEFDCTIPDPNTNGLLTLAFDGSTDIGSDEVDDGVALELLDVGSSGFDGFPDCAALIDRQGGSGPRHGRVAVLMNAGASAASESQRFGSPTFFELTDPEGSGRDVTVTGMAKVDLDLNGHEDLVVCGYTRQSIGTMGQFEYKSWIWVLWNDSGGLVGPIPGRGVGDPIPILTETNSENGAQVALQVAGGELTGAATGGPDIVVAFGRPNATSAQASLRAHINLGRDAGTNGFFDPTDASINTATAGVQVHDLICAVLQHPIGQSDICDMVAALDDDPGSAMGCWVWLNPDGAPVFPAAADKYVSQVQKFARRVRAFDFSFDGWLDVACATDRTDDHERTVSILRNQPDDPGKLDYVGDPMPTDLSADFRINVKEEVLAVGDANGDGCGDVVTVGITRCTGKTVYLSLLLGECTGSMRTQTLQVLHDGLGTPPNDVDAGVFMPGDNRPGVVITSKQPLGTGSQVVVLVQNPDGSFGDQNANRLGIDLDTNGVGGAVAWSSVVADFNTDGRDDFATVVGESAGPNVFVFRNASTNGTLDFPQQNALSVGANLRDVQSAQMDGVNGPDLVVTDISDHSFYVIFDNGFVFAPPMPPNGPPLINITHVVLTDPPAQDFHVQTPIAVALGDFDGDTQIDVATANFDGNAVSVVLRTSGGQFAANTNYLVGRSPISIVAGDLRRNGLIDLVTADNQSRTVSVVFNRGAGIFGDVNTNGDQYQVGGSPIKVMLVDVDADCLLDIVVLESDTNAISVLLNDRNNPGHFLQPRRTMPSGCNPKCMTWADFDLNGRMDLINCGEDGGILTKGLLRTTYNRCLGYGCSTLDSCMLCPTDVTKGDMHHDCRDCGTNGLCECDANTSCPPDVRTGCDCSSNTTYNCDTLCYYSGCCIDGDDIQRFVDVLFDPASAPRRCYCTADLNLDGYVSEADRLCFVPTLLGTRRPFEPCGFAGEECRPAESGSAGEGGNSAMAAGAGSGSPQSPGPDVRYELLAAWDAAHPAPDAPVLSAGYRAWVHARSGYQVELGLMTQALANGIDTFCAWGAVNRRRDHPELSASEYDAFVLAEFEADVASNSGGG